jgi:hypothetical protein
VNATTLDSKAGGSNLRVIYLLLGVGPWLFFLGYTAWEVVVPACNGMRELWPPPNAAGHWIVIFVGPWLIVMSFLNFKLKFVGDRTNELTLTISAVALGTCLVLIITQPFATSYALDATRAECERIGLSQGIS